MKDVVTLMEGRSLRTIGGTDLLFFAPDFTKLSMLHKTHEHPTIYKINLLPQIGRNFMKSLCNWLKIGSGTIYAM